MVRYERVPRMWVRALRAVVAEKKRRRLKEAPRTAGMLRLLVANRMVS